MADVKAGVAYVDVRLGSIEQFKNRLKAEIEGATENVSKRVGDKLAKDMAPEGTKIGKVTSGALAKAFFQDANQSFGGGLRALFQGQFRTFGGLMKEAGVASALGFRSSFDAGISGIGSIFRKAGQGVVSAARSTGSAAAAAFQAIPSKVAAAGQAVDAFGKRIGFLSFQLTNFGFVASTAFTAPVAAILTFGSVVGIKTAAQIEQATAALKSLTPAGTDVEALIKRLQSLAQASPIFNSADIITFTQRMVAAGLTVRETEDFLKSFGNIALTVGADVGKIPFALEALVQMVGKGNVTMEELRQQLGDALPGAMTIVSQALGVTTDELYDMVAAGQLSGEELVKALTKFGQGERFLKGAAEGAQTMGARWQELKESVQNQLGQIFLDNSDQIKKALEDLGPIASDFIKQIGPVFPQLIKGFGMLVEKIGDLISWYQNLSPSQQDIINKLMLAAIVIGPLVLALGVLGTAIAGISALFAAITTPVGLVITGLIAFGVWAGIVINHLRGLYNEGGKFKETWDAIWDSVMKLLEPLRREFEKILPQLKDGFNQIRDAVTQVTDKLGGFGNTVKLLGAFLLNAFAPVLSVIFGVFKGVIAAIGPLFKAISSLISGIIKILGGIITFLVGVFTGDWQKALDGLRMIWDGIWDAVVGTIVNVFKAIWNFVKGFVTGIVDFFKWLLDVLVGHSIIPDMVNAILDWFKRMVDRGVAFVRALGKPFVDFYNNFISPFINGVRRGIDRALDFIGGLPGRIRDMFSRAGSWLVDAGRNIVNGLISGVRRMGGTLRDAILNLIPGPVRSIVSSALGINSPSTVFAEFGKFVVLGFIEGVQKTAPKMDSAMGNAFAFAPATVSPSFGDPSRPIVEPANRGPALNIENYYSKDDDPRRQSEDWWFIINARGGDL